MAVSLRPAVGCCLGLSSPGGHADGRRPLLLLLRGASRVASSTTCSRTSAVPRGGEAPTDGSRQRDGLRNDTVLREAPARPSLTENCTLMLPTAAVLQLRMDPNIEDKGGEKTMWFGRLWQLRALLRERAKAKLKLGVEPELSELAELALKEVAGAPSQNGNNQLSCVAASLLMERVGARWKGLLARHAASLECLQVLDEEGVVLSGTSVLMHGSGGMTASNLRYARMLGGLGYLVVAPDSMAGGRFRTRSLSPPLGRDSDTDYWATNLLYDSQLEGRLAYSTEATEVIQHPDKWRQIYTDVHRLRAAELAGTLRRLPAFSSRAGVDLIGVSEGALAVAQFDTRPFESIVRSRIISAWSIEPCYFSPLPAHQRLGGSPQVPTLCLMGTADQFFGPSQESVASVVAEAVGSSRPTGNPFEAMQRQGLQRGLVVLLDEAKHDPTASYDDLLRDLLRSFLADPSRCHLLLDRWAQQGIYLQGVSVQERAGPDNGLVLARATGECHVQIPASQRDAKTFADGLASFDGEEWCDKVLAVALERDSASHADK